jgi:hypothetical protein
MKKIVFVLMGVALLVSCKYHVSKTVSSSAQEKRALTGFERIEMKGSMDVKYVQADSFSVKVSAPNDIIDKVETIVENNTLKVSMKHSGRIINFGGDSDDVTVYVTSPDFLGVSLMGSGDFLCAQPLDTDTLTIDLKGSGDIYFKDIICDHCSTELTGSGDIDIERLEARTSMVTLIGSGDIEVSQWKVTDTDVALRGSGDIEVNFMEGCQRAKCQLTGSGDIRLSGHLGQYNGEKHGSGDINIDKLSVENQNILK